MRIYDLPKDISYFVGCSSESADRIYFHPGNWWSDHSYIACFDHEGRWKQEFKVCVDENGLDCMETEF